jgi:hypothetical protein
MGFQIQVEIFEAKGICKECIWGWTIK